MATSSVQELVHVQRGRTLLLEANQAALGNNYIYAKPTKQHAYVRLTEAKIAPVPSATQDQPAPHLPSICHTAFDSSLTILLCAHLFTKPLVQFRSSLDTHPSKATRFRSLTLICHCQQCTKRAIGGKTILSK